MNVNITFVLVTADAHPTSPTAALHKNNSTSKPPVDCYSGAVTKNEK